MYNFIYNGGASKRYHTVQTHNTQDIASHSFGVAWWCELITDKRASKQLIMAALTHDLAEHIVGDVPSPAKRAMGCRDAFNAYEDTILTDNKVVHYMNLPELEKAVLKAADCFDGLMFCLNERRMGNKHVEIVYGRYYSYILEVKNKTCYYSHAIDDYLDLINNEWKELTNAKS
jgi:5'-deoxynucleotidase YfbR-like HD superfamily hydrolase